MWERGTDRFLYQVTAQKLERKTWDGSTVIEGRATAIQLGAVAGDGRLEFRPALPRPYQAIRSAINVTAPLPDGYERLGTIAGTSLDFGVARDQLRSHHLAVLGMSGMGKSTVARRICELLAVDGTVIAVDGTGEYRTRFGLPPLDLGAEGALGQHGAWVHEPVGSQARKARDLISTVMTSASQEYLAGDTPLNRSIIIEEAHSFLPEWNFSASRDEGNYVAESCRFILQARKFGINFVFISQRTAVISKSALSQCESYVIFRTLDGTSLDYVESIIGSDYRAAVSSLRRYQAVCVGPAFSTESPVIVGFDPPNLPEET